MIFRPDEYFQAGMERIREARLLYERVNSFAMAIYCGVLAVECVLRAFRWRRDRSFEGRHDLHELVKASEFLRLNEDRLRERGVSDDEIQNYSRSLRAAINEVVILWHNNLRFAPEARLRFVLNQLGRLRGIKGDPLKKNSADFLNAAHRRYGSLPMDLKTKVTEALREALAPEHILLEDDDGISGYVVAKIFHGMPALERQILIERALRNAPSKLTKAEQRNILAIAGLSPIEYQIIGVPSHLAHGDR